MTSVGRYRHYKGHLYEVLGRAKDSETTKELGVAYIRLDLPEAVVWVRPEEMFNQHVEGKPRFEKLSDKTWLGEQMECELNHYSAEKGRALEARVAELEAQLAKATQWTEDDLPLPEDDQIHAAHPTRSNEHTLYAEAFRMVGAKRSKFALVDLVHWLLVRLKVSEGRSKVR